MFVSSIVYIFQDDGGRDFFIHFLKEAFISFLGKDINERIPFECGQVLFAYSHLLHRERYAHNGFR